MADTISRAKEGVQKYLKAYEDIQPQPPKPGDVGALAAKQNLIDEYMRTYGPDTGTAPVPASTTAAPASTMYEPAPFEMIHPRERYGSRPGEQRLDLQKMNQAMQQAPVEVHVHTHQQPQQLPMYDCGGVSMYDEGGRVESLTKKIPQSVKDYASMAAGVAKTFAAGDPHRLPEESVDYGPGPEPKVSVPKAPEDIYKSYGSVGPHGQTDRVSMYDDGGQVRKYPNILDDGGKVDDTKKDAIPTVVKEPVFDRPPVALRSRILERPRWDTETEVTPEVEPRWDTQGAPPARPVGATMRPINVKMYDDGGVPSVYFRDHGKFRGDGEDNVPMGHMTGRAAVPATVEKPPVKLQMKSSRQVQPYDGESGGVVEDQTRVRIGKDQKPTRYSQKTVLPGGDLGWAVRKPTSPPPITRPNQVTDDIKMYDDGGVPDIPDTSDLPVESSATPVTPLPADVAGPDQPGFASRFATNIQKPGVAAPQPDEPTSSAYKPVTIEGLSNPMALQQSMGQAPVMDEGGPIKGDPYDGHHEMAILEEGERVLTPEQNQAFEQSPVAPEVLAQKAKGPEPSPHGLMTVTAAPMNDNDHVTVARQRGALKAKMENAADRNDLVGIGHAAIQLQNLNKMYPEAMPLYDNGGMVTAEDKAPDVEMPAAQAPPDIPPEQMPSYVGPPAPVREPVYQQQPAPMAPPRAPLLGAAPAAVPTMTGEPAAPTYTGALAKKAVAPAPGVPVAATAMAPADLHAQLQAKRAQLRQQMLSPDMMIAGEAQRQLAELDRQNPLGSPANRPGFGGKLLHGIGEAAQIGANIAAPGITAPIPGTELYRRGQEARGMATFREGVAEKAAEQKAQTEAAKAEAAQARAGAAQVSAEAAQAKVGDIYDPTLNGGRGGWRAATYEELPEPQKALVDYRKQMGQLPQIKKDLEEAKLALQKDPNSPQNQAAMERARAAATAAYAASERAGIENDKYLGDYLGVGRDGRDLLETEEGKPVGLKTATVLQKGAAGGAAGMDASIAYAKQYIQGGKWSGAEDETLMDQFFNVIKPEKGFRMTKPQQDMLRYSRSWMQSAEGLAQHGATGTWFTPQQREEMLRAMTEIGDAKKAAGIGGGGIKAAGGGAAKAPPERAAADGRTPEQMKGAGYTWAQKPDGTWGWKKGK